MILKRNFKQFQSDSRVLREARTLIENGHEVIVLLYGDEDKEGIKHFGIDVSIIGIKDVRHLEMYNNYSSKKRKSKARLNILQGIIEKVIVYFFYTRQYSAKTFIKALKEDADVYHCHDFETAGIGYRLKKRNHKSIVYDSHELWFGRSSYKGAAERLQKYIQIPVEKKIIRSVDACITVNHSISEILSQKYKVKSPYILRNVPENVQTVDEGDLLREDLNIDKDQKVVLYQGGLIPGRGLHSLIDAWKYVNPGIVLVIMGYGELYSQIKDKISNKSYEGRVFLKDAVKPEVLLAYTKSADVGICPFENTCMNNFYGSPNKVFEYISAQIPILVSDFPEMKRLAEKENMGLTIDASSPEDISNKINYLFDKNNEEVYNTMKKNCVEKSTKKYNWDIEKKTLLDIYNNLKQKQTV
jgi:glycosyltransferase involved in cell wall biosynthesis